MGVDKLFYSLEKTESIKKDGINLGFNKKVPTDYFYDDFNSTVYTIVLEIEKELNYLLYAIILHLEENIQLDTMALLYAKKWKFDLNNLTNPTIDSYKNYFTSKLIDIVALERIKEYMIFKATQLIEPHLLKLYMVSIDGVPQMAKEGEQKKRRLNGEIISRLKKKIHEKSVENNTIPKLRQLYEVNKISYDRGKIISWTSFMKSIEILLTSEQFLIELKNVCPNLEKVIVSHQDVCGEGEKKIMEYILETKLVGRYTFFSPDADAIMLAIIGQNMLNNGSIFTILRHNQQSEEYDTINIDMICDNIFTYVQNKIIGDTDISITTTTANLTKQNVTNDIAFIFTLFGNDFIPRVESIDVRNNIETLLDIYCAVMRKAQKKCLIFRSFNSDFQRINYYNFAEFIKALSAIEHSMLNETYLANKYKNYRFLKRELKVDNLLPTIESYIVAANKFFTALRSEKDTNKIINAYAIDTANTKFIEQFLIFEGCNFKRDTNGLIINIIEKFTFQIQKILAHFANVGKEIKEIKGRHIFQQHEAFNISTGHHKKNIMETFPHPLMEITEYDIECYKLDRKLGEYETKLNATNFDLGAVKVSYDSANNYVIKYSPKHNNIAAYYKTFFGISHEVKECVVRDGSKKKIITFEDQKMTQLVEDYIKGIFWVFDTYFNKNNSEQNANYVSTWIYPHHRSPLIYQVKEVLFKFANMGSQKFIDKMNSLYSEVTINNTYMVPRQLFMNKLEHYLYVTPFNKHNELPKIYKEFVENNRDIFPDLSKISDQIWINSDNTHLLDCKRISFVNKCNLLCVKFVSFNDFMQRIIGLRNMDLFTTELINVTPYTPVRAFEKVFVNNDLNDLNDLNDDGYNRVNNEQVNTINYQINKIQQYRNYLKSLCKKQKNKGCVQIYK